MATFMLLLRGGDFSKYSPSDMPKIIEDYMGWSAQLQKQGKYKGGDELKEGGRVLSVKDGKTTDGPFTETKEVVGGYYLIEDETMESATSTARGCPHLKYGGSVEVREINPH